MAKQIEGVYERILECAKAEFLDKGYADASLRTISAKAKTSTNSIYVRFKDKKGLFEALVGEVYECFMNQYKQAHEMFEKLPMDVQPQQMGKLSRECMDELLDYSYEHMEELQLILCYSDGTRYAFMIDEMVEIEVESTHKYYITLEKLGHPVPKIDERLEHILITGMMSAYFEIILHEMPYENAKLYLQELCDFHTAGWAKIMGQ